AREACVRWGRHRHHGPHGPRRWRMWRAARRLQTRMFLWFLVALVVAFGVHAGSLWMQMQQRDETPSVLHIATRAISAKAAREWDDPAALDRYLAHVRDPVGLDMHVQRDLSALPHMKNLRGGSVTFDGHGGAFVPVLKDGELVGALEFEAGRPPRRP